MSVVYLNGEYLPKADAKISPDDRGFLLGDGLYEVAAAYEGVLFGFDEHLARLERGLRWMRIDYDTSELEEVFRQLIARNGLDSADRSLVYLQITRGVAERDFAYPADAKQTIVAFTQEKDIAGSAQARTGIKIITIPDIRWQRRDIKSTGMLAQAIEEAGTADDVVAVANALELTPSWPMRRWSKDSPSP